MKYGRVINNKIVELYDTEVLVNEGLKELPANAKLGDVFDPQRASREENILNEMPSVHDLTVTLWESIVSGDNTARDALEARRQEIKNKYPRLP